MFTVANRRAVKSLIVLLGVGACASVVNAQPWGWHRQRRVVVVEPQPRVIVVQQPSTPPPVVIVARPEVTPADLKMAAYQSGETVIVTVSGCNATAGYTTSVGAVDLNPWSPSLIIHNSAPTEACAAAQTPFSVTASLHASHALGAVTLRVGEQVFQVTVTQAVSLS